MRISNLIWQLSYAELWFTETYWPDFDIETRRKLFTHIKIGIEGLED